MLKILTLGVVLGISIFPTAYATNNGSGTVTMQGEIIDSACAIDMDSQEQIIDMGILPTGVIQQMGMGPARNIDIYLVNCTLEKADAANGYWNTLRMTFDGPRDGNLFSVAGDAAGVGLYLEDANQYQVIPGEALPAQPITPPTMRLNYQLRLATNHRPLRPGNYQAMIRFKVDYE